MVSPKATPVKIVVQLEERLKVELDADAAVDLGRALRRAGAGQTPGDATSAAILIREVLVGETPRSLRWSEKEEASVLAVLNGWQELAGQHPCLGELHETLLARS